jgi:NADH dehydrogenase FAD-containing subunit
VIVIVGGGASGVTALEGIDATLGPPLLSVVTVKV